MRKYRITLDGKTYEMEIELISESEAAAAETKLSGKAAAAGDPKEAAPVTPAAKPAAQDKPTAGKGSVTSPMPGSITKVCLATGDSVSRGQTVLILEAMKMENEISAPKDGKLGKLYVNQGDTVQGGDPLFEIGD